MSILSAAAIVGLATAQTSATTGPDPLPLPPRLTADVSDTLSLRSNPAGLGALLTSELRLLYGFEPGASDPALDGVSSDLHSGGLYGAWKLGDVLTLAGGYDFSARGEGASAERGLLGVGFDFGIATWGLSWELRDDFDRGEVGFVRLGFQSRPTRWTAFGLAIQDLGEAVGERAWDIGLALRPGLDWLTVSSQWRLTETIPVNGDTLDLRFLLNAEPIPGLVLGFGTDHDFDRLDFQLALDFGYGGNEGAVLVRDDQPLVSAQAVVRAEPAPALGQPDKMIVIELAGDLEPDFGFDVFQGQFQVGTYGSAPLLLDAVARSDGARGAFVRISALEVGWGKVQELRRGLEAIRGRGKDLVCSVDVPGDREYYLASACDRIIGLPSTILAVDGVAANLLFLGSGLSNLGVDIEVNRREAYKSAPDALTRSSPSSEQEEVVASILDEAYDTLVDGIAAGRRVDRARVVAMVDRGTVTATEAVAQGWLDATVYPDEAEDWIRKELGGVVFGAPKDVLAPRRREWGMRPKIAVIPIDAVITGGESRAVPFGFGGTSGARTISRALKKASKDPSVRAIVLRVDSGGGGAIASELIARAVEKASEEKPVITSFGDTAASGGYMVAAPSQYIFAEETTITGSIGVFSLRASIHRLLAKLGISASEYERGRHANLGSPLVPLREEDRSVGEKQVAFLYDRFLKIVAEGRNMPLDDVREVAQGRVWTGAQAKANGLVDEIGGLPQAIRYARDAAGLSPRAEVDVEVLPASRRSFPEYVARVLGDEARAEADDGASLAALVPPELRRWAAILAALEPGEAVALPATWIALD